MSVIEQLKEKVENAKTTLQMANQMAIQNRKKIAKDLKEGKEQWEVLGQKAVGGGSELAKDYKAIFTEAVEEVKGQLEESKNRFKNLVKVEQ